MTQYEKLFIWQSKMRQNGGAVQNWRLAMSRFIIEFGDRLMITLSNTLQLYRIIDRLKKRDQISVSLSPSYNNNAISFI